MDSLWTLVAGGGLGLVVIAVLNAFPGEPFDYDKNETPVSGDSGLSIKSGAGGSTYASRAREVEIAASQLKVNKLQELLGLEKHEVQKMIDQAKEDAIQGRQPRASVDYSRWFDWVFYGLVFVLMAMTLRSEYSLDIIQLLGKAFPREVEAARKIAAFLPTPWMSTWT